MIWFISSLFFAILIGIAENRLYFEQNTKPVIQHFKAYHIYLFCTVVLVAFLGCEENLAKFIFGLVWTPLILDIVWWLIRYMDITHLGESVTLFGHTIWKYPDKNFYDGGYGKSWHSIEDWDNYGKLPLIHGTYAWWYMFTFILIGLGVIIAIW